MRDRQGSHRWGSAVAVLLLMTLPLLYPLSVGPAVLFYESMGRPRSVELVLEPIYEPLESLPEPFYSALVTYG